MKEVDGDRRDRAWLLAELECRLLPPEDDVLGESMRGKGNSWLR